MCDAAKPNWAELRPRRSGAARRAQAERAGARAVQRLLKGFEELTAHRGCQPSRLGTALGAALGGKGDWDRVHDERLARATAWATAANTTTAAAEAAMMAARAATTEAEAAKAAAEAATWAAWAATVAAEATAKATVETLTATAAATEAGAATTTVTMPGAATEAAWTAASSTATATVEASGQRPEAAEAGPASTAATTPFSAAGATGVDKNLAKRMITQMRGEIYAGALELRDDLVVSALEAIEGDMGSGEHLDTYILQAKQAAETVLKEYAGTCFGMQAKGVTTPSAEVQNLVARGLA